MLKELKEDLNKWKGLPCSWIGRFNIVKMLKLPKRIYRVNAITIKIPGVFFCRNRQADPKVHTDIQGTQSGKINSKKAQSWRIYTSRFKTCYKVRVIKIVCTGVRLDIQIRGLETNIQRKPLYLWSVDVFLMKEPRPFNREKIVFSTNGAGPTRYL